MAEYGRVITMGLASDLSGCSASHLPARGSSPPQACQHTGHDHAVDVRLVVVNQVDHGPHVLAAQQPAVVLDA